MSYPSLFNTDTESLLSEFSSTAPATNTGSSTGNGVAAGTATSTNGPPMMANQPNAYSSQYASGGGGGSAPGYAMYNYPGQQTAPQQAQQGYYAMQPGKMMPQGAYMNQPPQQQQQSMNQHQQPPQQTMYNTAPSGPYAGQPMTKMNNQMVGGAPPNMANAYPANNTAPMNQQMWSNNQMSGYNNTAMSSPQFKQQQQQQAPPQMMTMPPMQQQAPPQPMYNKMNQFNNASKPMAHQQHQQQQQQAQYGNFKPSGMPNGAPMPPNQPGYMSGGKPMAMQQHQQQMQSPQQGQIHSGAGGPPGYGYNPNMKLSSLPPHMQHPQQQQQQQPQQGSPMMQPTQQQQAQFNPQSPSNSNKMNLVGSPYQQQQQQQQIKPMASVTAAPAGNASTTGVPNATSAASSINVNVPGGGGYSTNTAASTLSPNRSMSQPPSTATYYNTTQTTTYNTTPSGYTTYTGSVMPSQGQQYVTTGPGGVYSSYGAPNGVYSTANTGYGMAQPNTGPIMTTDPMSHHSTPTVQQQSSNTATTPDSASTTPTKRGRGRGKKQSANSETSSPTAGDLEPQEGAKPKGKRGKKSNTTPEPSLSLSPGPLASSTNNTTGSSSMLYAPSVSSSSSMPPARPPSNSYPNTLMGGPATSPSSNRATPVGSSVPQPTTVYTGPPTGSAYPPAHHHYPPGAAPQQQPAPYGQYTSNSYPIAQNSQNVMNTGGQMNGSGMVYNTAPNATPSNTSMPYMMQQPGMMKPIVQAPLQSTAQASPVASATTGPQLISTSVAPIVKKPEDTVSPTVGGVSPASANQPIYTPSSNGQSQPGLASFNVNSSSSAPYPVQQATTPNYNSAPVASTTPNSATQATPSSASSTSISVGAMPANPPQGTAYTSSSTMSSQQSTINHNTQSLQPNLMSTQSSQDNSVKPPQTVVASPYMSSQTPHMNNSNGQAMMHPPHPSMPAYSAYPNDNNKPQPQMIPVVMSGPGAPTAPQTVVVQAHGAYMMPPPVPPMGMSMAPGQPVPLQPQQSPYMQHPTTLQTGESYNLGYSTTMPPQPITMSTGQQETTPVKKLTKKQLREMQQSGMEVDPDSASKKQRKLKPKQQKSSADNSLVEGGEVSNGPNNNAHIESTIDDLMKQYNINSKKKPAGKKKKKIKDLDEENDDEGGSESEMDDDEDDADYNDEGEDKADEQVEGEKPAAKKRGPKRGQKKAKSLAEDSFDEELAAMIEKSANEEEPRKKRKYTKKKAKEAGDEASELDSTAAAETPGDDQPVVQTPDLGDRFKRIVLSNNASSNSNRGRRKSTQNLIKLMKKKQRKKRKKTSSGEEDAEDDDSDEFEINTLPANNKSSTRKENENSGGGDASNTETGPGENGDDAAMARELQDNNKRRSVRSAASKKTKFVTIKDEDLLMPVDPNEEEPAEPDTNIVVASQDNFIVDKILGMRLAKRKTMRKKEKPPKQPKAKKEAKSKEPLAETVVETVVEPVEIKEKPVIKEEEAKMEVDSDAKSPETNAIQETQDKPDQSVEKSQEIEVNGVASDEAKAEVESDVKMESETVIPKENDQEINDKEEESKEQEETKSSTQVETTTTEDDNIPTEEKKVEAEDETTPEKEDKMEAVENVETKSDDKNTEPIAESVEKKEAEEEEEEEDEEDEVSEYEEDGGEIEVEEFFVKYKNLSYLHCEWRTRDEIFSTDKRIDQKIKRFKLKRQQAAQAYDWDDEFGDTGDPRGYNNEYDELFNPDYQVVDRILDESEMDDLANPTGPKLKYFLVKWKSLPYDEASWELEQDLKDKRKIERFHEVNKYQPDVHAKYVPKPKAERWTQLNSTRTYKKGNKLREYQLEGINWLTFCWLNGRNCILADEMGLGKTVQSITYLQEIYNYGVRGPFLVIVPLSTMGNWMKEFENWTDFNVIVYHGSSISRQMIQDYEFYFKDDNNSIISVNQLGKKQPVVKFNALVTTYEVLLSDVTLFCQFKWRTTVIDEAHRLKNKNCKLIEGLRYLDVEHKVLLTGTPLQNNVEELFSLLNFLEPSQFKSSQEFLEDFGDLKTDTQVTKLQTILKPMMLRRLKEDVEKNLAPKEETIVEVELTNIQKKYYRAILEKNFQFLARGAVGSNVPNLMNTMMELRKCCNHPYLINGAEDAIVSEYIEQQNRTVADKTKPEKHALKAMVQSSGKLVLVDKLLPKLKAGGHKVLIFSQMIRVLDILEDYLIQNRFTYERIDGRIRGDLRQEAIERYSKPDSDRFVFLLCTRAGGLGINLTAADTVIIYDSDWNPQNDLQAQARCHRIGQQKAVKIYRLITRNTYEREMFDKASLKLGLDKAVLQSMRSDDRLNHNMQLSKAEIEELLKKGAYGAIMEDDNAGDKFCEEDIDKILQQRSTVIQIEGGEKGSTFSKASFQASDTNTEISLDDPEFWQKWARKAEIDVQEKLNPRDERIIYEPRKRMQTRRYGGPDDLLEESDYSSASGSDNENGAPNDKKTRGRKKRGREDEDDNDESAGAWTRDDCYKVEKNLLIYGWSRWATILRHCEPLKKKSNLLSEQETESLARAICAFALKNYHGEESIRQFIIDMIDPAKSNFDALKSHQGLAAPVPRGRKRADVSASVSATTTSSTGADLTELEWAKNVDDLLDNGYKRHLIRQASKLLLRLRTLFYIKHEIIGDDYAAKLDQFHLSNSEVDETISHDQIDLQLPDVLTELPTEWWDKQCDQSLLIGVYKHGFERYYQIRMDPKLCFLQICGQPDANEAQEEANVEKNEEGGDDEEEEKGNKKRGRKKKKDEDEMGDDETMNEEKETKTPVKDEATPSGEEKQLKHFPSHHELNNRMRRLIAAVQKHKKQLQLAEKRNADKQEKRTAKLSAQQERANLRQAEKQIKWSRREEQNFYKTISTYGVDCLDPATQTYAWERFKEIGQLDKKLDETLTDYLHSFMVMCKRVCNNPKFEADAISLPPDVQPVQVEQISEERASRCLQRIELLNKVRKIPKHEKFTEWLADERLLPSSPDLPDWYMPGKHDRDLIIGAARYGLTPRTDYYFLNDPDLQFRPYLEKYMRHIERLMDEDNKVTLQSGDAQHLQTDPIQYYFQNQARIQMTFRQQVIDKEMKKLIKKHKMAEKLKEKEEKPTSKEEPSEQAQQAAEEEMDVSQKMIIDETLIEEKEKTEGESEEKENTEKKSDENQNGEELATEEETKKEEDKKEEPDESTKEAEEVKINEAKPDETEKEEKEVQDETKPEEKVKEPEESKELKTEVVEDKTEEKKEDKVEEESDEEEEAENVDEPPPTNYFATIVGSGVGTPMILWPKERVLAHRLESIIQAFENNGEWPMHASLAQQHQQLAMMHMNSPMMANNPLSIANLIGVSSDWGANGMDNDDDMDDDQDMNHMDLKLMSGSVDSPSSATSSAKYPKPKRGRPPKSELLGDENKFLEPGEIMNQRMRAANKSGGGGGRFNDAASEHSDTSSTSSHSNLKSNVAKRGRKSMTPLNQNQQPSTSSGLDNINQSDLATLAALFLQPGMDPDERVTVVNIHDQTKLTGHRAPRRSELAMWLLTHPNYIPDEAEIMNLSMKAAMAQQQPSQTPPIDNKQSKLEASSPASNNPIVLFNKVTNKRVNPMKVPPLKSLATFLERNEQIYIDQSSNEYLRSKYPRGQLPDIIRSRMMGSSPAKTTRTDSPVNTTKSQQQQSQNQPRKPTTSSNNNSKPQASSSSASSNNQPALPAGMEQLAALFGAGASANPLEAMMGQMPGLNELLGNPAALGSMMMDPNNPLAGFLAMAALSGGQGGSSMLPPFPPFGDTSSASNPAFNPFLVPPVPGLPGAGGAGNLPPAFLTDMIKEMMSNGGGGGGGRASTSNSELEMAFNELANQFSNNEHLNKEKPQVRDSPAPSRRKPSSSNPAPTPPPAPSPKPSISNNKSLNNSKSSATASKETKKSDNLNMLSKKITDHNQKKATGSNNNAATSKTSGNGSSHNNNNSNNTNSADLTALMQQLASGQINDPAMLAALLNPELIQEIMSMQGGGNPFMPPTNNNNHTSSSSSSPAPFSPAVSNTKSKQSQQHHVKSKSPPQRPPSTVERSNVASPALSANSNNSSSVLQPPGSMPDMNMFINMMMGMGGAGGLGSNPLSALMPPPPTAGLGAGFGAEMPMELIAAALANPSALAGLDPSMFSALAQLSNLSNAAASSSDIPDMSRQSRKAGNNSNNSKQSSTSQPQSKRLKLTDESGGGDFPGLDLSMKKEHNTPSRSSTSKTKK